MFDIKVWDDLGKYCTDEEVSGEVEKILHLFYSINTHKATHDLTHVKTLLQIAYTTTKDFHPGTKK